MKCIDCKANNGRDVCMIGRRCRMMVCGHYGCDLQSWTIEKLLDRIESLEVAKLGKVLDKGMRDGLEGENE